MIPPAWVAFYSSRWDVMRTQAVIHLTAFCAVCLCGVLYIRAHPLWFDGHALAPVRNWVAPAHRPDPLVLNRPVFISDYEVQQQALAQASTAEGSFARYRGEPLRFSRVLYRDGVLRFKQAETPASVEFLIDLGPSAPGFDKDGLTLDITPTSVKAPLVLVIREQPASAAPLVDAYSSGYWLELLLTRTDQQQFEGQILLRLPDADKSYLAGSFQASPLDLQWQLGEVDRDYDSNDTIEYVARQYLSNHLSSNLRAVEGFRDTYFQTGLPESTASTRARITLADGSQLELGLSLFKNAAGWVVEPAPTRDLISALQTMRQAPTASIPPASVLAQPSRLATTELEQLVGQKVTLVTHDGRSRHGQIQAVDRYNVSLVNRIGAGEMAVLVRRRDIKEVLLGTPSP
ncbi:MAG: hypothetical protein CML06_19965 [Pseudomonadales bacterium]|nr:hypothetical protein [Pseudomonadales bacterium]